METTDTRDTNHGHALIVEDDVAIRELLRLHLSMVGFGIAECADGTSAMDLVRTSRFDLIVLDVMLPGIDGISICRALRSEGGVNATTAILMVTARDTESDKVLGLESGADDYLTKPFGVREFVARVKAILRRHVPAAERSGSAALASRDVSIDVTRRQVVVRGHDVDLTRQEFDLLHLFMQHPGIVFSRTALISKIWGGDTYVTERTVDAVVSRLRKKIERDAQDPELLLTAWGVGYKFVDVD
jgi:DNA-binding response OmpR family regulator